MKCDSCKVDCDLSYKITLLTKDTSTLRNKYCYKILLFSRPGEGEDFFKGIKPCNLYRDEEALETIEKYLKLMTKFNIYVDGVVRKVNDWCILHNTTVNVDIKE
jgi:hypothetical protein